MGLRPEELEEFRRYLRVAIRRICPRWLSNEVDDLTNGALLHVIDIASRRPSSAEFTRGYLSRVAFSHVIDEIRRRRHELCGEDYLADVDGPPCDQPDPEKTLAMRELQRAIWSCLEKIAGARRLAAWLWLMGYRNPEIVDLTGWNDKQVENYVTRGRENLRDCLRGLGHEP